MLIKLTSLHSSSRDSITLGSTSLDWGQCSSLYQFCLPRQRYPGGNEKYNKILEIGELYIPQNTNVEEQKSNYA